MGFFDKIKDAFDGKDDAEKLAEEQAKQAEEAAKQAEQAATDAFDPNTMAVPADETTYTSGAEGLAPEQGGEPVEPVVEEELPSLQDLANDLRNEGEAIAADNAATDAPAADASPDLPAAEAAPEVAAPAAEVPAPAAPAPVTYTVVEGDNLSTIGEQYGVSYMAIAEANGIENPDLIYPGQVLTIPQA